MTSASFRDKLMARLILEEIIGKTLVESSNGIVPLSSLTVAGFDQDIYVKDLLEDYGWLGSWMHLSEMYQAVSIGSGKVFKEEFAPSTDWLGGVMPLTENVQKNDSSPRIINESNDHSENSEVNHVSFSRTQLLLRLSLLQTISIGPDNKVQVAAPSYQTSLIDKTLSSGRSAYITSDHKHAVSEMFFDKIRSEVLPSLFPHQASEPVKGS